MKYIVDVNGKLPDTGALSKAKRLCVTKAMEALHEEFCDYYCKYPDLYKADEEKLYEVCENCPI